MSNTLSEIRSYIRGSILEAADSTVFTDEILNEAINEQYRNILDNELSYLVEDIAVGASSAKVFGAVPEKGSITINGDVLKFTGVTPGTEYHTLTGVSAFTLPHFAGEVFEISSRTSTAIYPQSVPPEIDDSNDCIFPGSYGKSVLGPLAGGHALLKAGGMQKDIVNNIKKGEANLAIFVKKYRPPVKFNAW